jgi:ribosomal protein S18 acetylase RimI-like enzyme
MTESDIAVRTAGPADASDIAELGAKTFFATYASHNTPEDIDAYIAVAFSTERILGELEDPDSAFLLVVRDDTNIGFAKLQSSQAPDCVSGSNPIELERIYVDANNQGGGVGSLLMEAVLDYARSEGRGSIWLGVWEKNTAACEFYERQGFSPVGSKNFTVGSDRQNDVVMIRLLD